MKTIIIVALATIAILCACSPKMNANKNKSVNKISTDTDGKPMLIGECTESSLRQAPFNNWYDKNFTTYAVNDTITALIKPLMPGKKFLIFMGTWCGDSRREIPRMFKILESCGVKSSQIKLVMLDDHDSAYKQSPLHEEKGLNIHRVPALLVYENNNELGRIVESPVVSLEKDLLAIFNKKDYKPNYQGVVYMNNLFSEGSISSIEDDLSQTATQLKPILKNASELNTYGYVLMYSKELSKALIIFKLNAMLYPANANVFDSLGEYYFNNGNKEAAKENYKKVLEIDPKNENAKKMLEKIGE